MTRTKTNTGRFSGPGRAAQIRMRDFANAFACTQDRRMISVMDQCLQECLSRLYAMQEEDPSGYAELWTDGSYNKEKNAAGIGIMIRMPGAGTEPAVFGKPVKAAGSAEAEVYAMAIGLSYLLDTYPGIKSVRLRYDCLAAGSSAASLEAYACKGAPYTNLRSAMKRARKSGVTVLFQQVKAHAGHDGNEGCDVLAKYYAKAQLTKAQKERIAPYVLKAPHRQERK